MADNRRRVLVTGATSGLGREMAAQLAREGCRVAVTGRRADRLKETAHLIEEAGGEALALAGDATNPEDVRRHYAAIRERWDGLDWAILNAGIADNTPARDFDAAKAWDIFTVNVRGIALWLEAVIPGMVAAHSGTIAGISSLAAFRGLPDTGAYCASKSAVNTLLESVRIGLRGTGVSVVTVCPGFVRSEITDRNDPKQMPFLLETADGARRILKGVKARRRLVHFPAPLSYPMVYLVSRLPYWLYDPIFSRFRKRKVSRPV